LKERDCGGFVWEVVVVVALTACVKLLFAAELLEDVSAGH